MGIFISLIIGVIVLIVVLYLAVGRLLRRRKIPAAVVAQTWQQWAAMRSMSDAHRRVLEAEKILDGILTRHGYAGTFADKLRAVGRLLPNEQAVWEAHKLRNRVAHEVGLSLQDRQANSAVAAFEKALRSLL